MRIRTASIRRTFTPTVVTAAATLVFAPGCVSPVDLGDRPAGQGGNGAMGAKPNTGGTQNADTGGTGASTGGTSTSTGGTRGSPDSGGGTGGVPTSGCLVSYTASDADNYALASTLITQVTAVKPSSELTFDWSDVTTDLLGHPLRPEDVGMVEIGLWNLTLAEFETKLNSDSLVQSDLAIIATILPPTPTTTTGSIYDLTESGEKIARADIDNYLDIDNFPPENHIYTAMVASGTDVGKGTRMVHAFRLDRTSTNTLVNIASDSTRLDVSVDLHSHPSPVVPANAPRIVIDWNHVNATAQGLPFDPQAITEVRVAKYAETVADLERRENFLNLDTVAEELYRADVLSGTRFDLSFTRDANDQPFSGIDDTGTWLVALNCGTCSNPAPWYMTVLTACHPGDADCTGFTDATCQGAFCGDGIVDPGEACDDGNELSGDGCSSACQVEPGFSCAPPGAPCVPN